VLLRQSDCAPRARSAATPLSALASGGRGALQWLQCAAQCCRRAKRCQSSAGGGGGALWSDAPESHYPHTPLLRSSALLNWHVCPLTSPDQCFRLLPPQDVHMMELPHAAYPPFSPDVAAIATPRDPGVELSASVKQVMVPLAGAYPEPTPPHFLGLHSPWLIRS